MPSSRRTSPPVPSSSRIATADRHAAAQTVLQPPTSPPNAPARVIFIDVTSKRTGIYLATSNDRAVVSVQRYRAGT